MGLAGTPSDRAAEVAAELGTLLGSIVNLATVVRDECPGELGVSDDLTALVGAARRGADLATELAELATGRGQPD